jgi:subtilase family serine protease
MTTGRFLRSNLVACTAIGAALMLSSLTGVAQAAPLMKVAATGAQTTVAFSVALPLRDKAGLESLVARQQDKNSADYHKWLTPDAFMSRFGPSADTVAKVSAALRAQGLAVSQKGRLLHVSGSSQAVARALGSEIAMGRSASGFVRPFAAHGMTLPAVLKSAGVVIMGLEQADLHAHTFLHRVAMFKNGTLPQNRSSQTGGYWFTDLKQAYSYPSYQAKVTINGVKQRLDGTNATIAILMSSDVLDSDIDMVFTHEKFTTYSGLSANPKLYKRVMVDGGATTSSDAFDEASLDTQEALTGAPGAHVDLYAIPDLSDAHIIDGYNSIVADNEADVVSSSFGECELYYTAAYNDGTDYTSLLKTEHEIYLQGNAQGITFLASSGDEAGLECVTPAYFNGQASQYVAGVSTPAADPNVTAVGGTNVVTRYTAGSLDSTYVGENAYSDPLEPEDPYGVGVTISNAVWGAGGGVSQIFGKPVYQWLSPINTGSSRYRALPDVGMQVGGCPYGAVTPCNGGDTAVNGHGNTQRSYVIVADAGSYVGLIGTSVSSPEFASATALLVQLHGRQGNLNPYLYLLGALQSATGIDDPIWPTTAFHRNIPGYNGVVSNDKPKQFGRFYFNYTVGNGTPIVTHFIGAPLVAAAGAPQTSSNP